VNGRVRRVGCVSQFLAKDDEVHRSRCTNIVCVVEAQRTKERRLAGGNLSKVSKVGSTVRRPAGPHTSAVHALLTHLRAAGFKGAPLPLGIDERGREVLEYLCGRIHMPQRDGPLGRDRALADAGRLLRAFHDASATFAVPHDAQWDLGLSGPAALMWKRFSPVVVCHNDAAVWNLIVCRWRAHALIDWDFAAPAPRIWDLASMARSLAPLLRATARRALGWPDDHEVGRRLRLLVDAYAATQAERAVLIEATIARAESDLRYGRRALADGDPAWVLMDHRGVLRDNEDDAADLIAMRDFWTTQLSV
jgi:hypothetical protein